MRRRHGGGHDAERHDQRTRLPGGNVEPGEDLHRALRRELAQELDHGGPAAAPSSTGGPPCSGATAAPAATGCRPGRTPGGRRGS
ncbi:NUDIX domain-containing protein [Streptomyces sp. NPDC059816]|uniref:NUDIX domain-containing protein n=1 Tax=Streptomyces sp. NPDC059816 TaxID=3346960 RepID=UPI003662E9A3